MGQRWDADANKQTPSADTKLMSVDALGKLKYVKSGELRAYVQNLLAGIATPTTNPTVTEGVPMMYLAMEAGTYTHFLDAAEDPIVVLAGEFATLFTDGTVPTAWTKDAMPYEVGYQTWEAKTENNGKTLSDYIDWISRMTDLTELADAVEAAHADALSAEESKNAAQAAESQTLLYRNAAAAIVSGGPRGVYATAAALITANPDHAFTYVVTADGHWYYWNGSTFADGGAYQTVQDYALNENIKPFTRINNTVLLGKIYAYSGPNEGGLGDHGSYDCTEGIKCIGTAGSLVKVSGSVVFKYLYYTGEPAHETFITTNSNGVIPAGTTYIALDFLKSENTSGYAELDISFENSAALRKEIELLDNRTSYDFTDFTPGYYESVDGVATFFSKPPEIELYSLVVPCQLNDYFEILATPRDNAPRYFIVGADYVIKKSAALTIFYGKESIKIADSDASFLIVNHDLYNGLDRIGYDKISYPNIAYVIKNAKKKAGVCLGDSLTHGFQYDDNNSTSVTAELNKIIPTYEFLNAGYDGEGIREIMARQGSNALMLKNNVELPASEPIQIGTFSNSGIVSAFEPTVELPILRFNVMLGSQYLGHFNPCYINGVECIIAFTGTTYADETGIYTMQRIKAGSGVSSFKAGDTIHTFLSKNFSNPDVLVLWMGTNGSFSSTQQLVDYHRKATNYLGKSSYIIMGLTLISEYWTLPIRLEQEAAMRAEFGARYFNTRKYLVEKALSDMSIAPTETDLEYIELGKVPPSLTVNINDVHLNRDGYYAIARYGLYELGKNLGYW